MFHQGNLKGIGFPPPKQKRNHHMAAYRYSRLETGQGWTLKALSSYEVSNFWSPHHYQLNDYFFDPLSGMRGVRIEKS